MAIKFKCENRKNRNYSENMSAPINYLTEKFQHTNEYHPCF